MREQHASRETWRLGARRVVGATALQPVERVLRRDHRGDGHAWCSFTLEPYALLIRDAAGWRAIGVDARPIPLATLRAKLDGLDSLLASG